MWFSIAMLVYQRDGLLWDRKTQMVNHKSILVGGLEDFFNEFPYIYTSHFKVASNEGNLGCYMSMGHLRLSKGHLYG